VARAATLSLLAYAPTFLAIPAKAGTHLLKAPARTGISWVPAFAGMTKVWGRTVVWGGEPVCDSASKLAAEKNRHHANFPLAKFSDRP